MYVRLVTGFIPAGKLDHAIELWRTEVLSSVQQQAGFRNVRLFVDRESGKIGSMGLWETRADFEATVAWNEREVAKFTSLFDEPPTVEGFDLVVKV
jgi:hypothetical protein